MRHHHQTGHPLSQPYTYDILHYYDFVTFHVGPIHDKFFEHPCGQVCVSLNRTWTPRDLPATPCPQICDSNDNDASTSSSSNWSSSQVGGLAFGMVLLGVALGVIGMFLKSMFHKKSDVSSSLSVLSGGNDNGKFTEVSAGDL